MFCFTAAAHFNSMRPDMIAMVPPSVPNPEFMVTFTGICEILGAIGLLVPRTRRIAATLEGILAGRGVEARFADLRLPRYSPPLSVWFVIGGVFYLICFTVLYRLFSLTASGLRDAALALLVGMLLARPSIGRVSTRGRSQHGWCRAL